MFFPSCSIKTNQYYVAGKQTGLPSILNVLGLSEGLLGAVGVQIQELPLCVKVCIAPFGTHSQVEAKLRWNENKHKRRQLKQRIQKTRRLVPHPWLQSHLNVIAA